MSKNSGKDNGKDGGKDSGKNMKRSIDAVSKALSRVQSMRGRVNNDWRARRVRFLDGSMSVTFKVRPVRA